MCDTLCLCASDCRSERALGLSEQLRPIQPAACFSDFGESGPYDAGGACQRVLHLLHVSRGIGTVAAKNDRTAQLRWHMLACFEKIRIKSIFSHSFLSRFRVKGRAGWKQEGSSLLFQPLL